MVSEATLYRYFICIFHHGKSHNDATLSSEGTSAQARHAAQISASVIGIMVHVLNVANADCENNSSSVETAVCFKVLSDIEIKLHHKQKEKEMSQMFPLANE